MVPKTIQDITDLRNEGEDDATLSEIEAFIGDMRKYLIDSSNEEIKHRLGLID